MAKFNLTWRFALAVGLTMLTGAAASGVLLWQLYATSVTYDAVLGEQQVQDNSARVMQVDFKKQVQEWKNLLLRGHKDEDFKKYRDSFKKEEAAVRETAAKLLQEVSNADARQQLQGFLTAHNAMGTSYEAAIREFEKGKGVDPGAADAMVKGMDRAPTDMIDAFVVRMQAVVADVRKVQLARVNSSIRLSLGIVSMAFFAILVFVGFMIRNTRREIVELATDLKESAQQTTSAAGQVSTSAQSLSQGSTEQAASLEETSASMEEMASMTRKNAENATQAAKLVNSVTRQVTDSNAALGQMVGSMTAIKESSSKVAKIIKTIDEIAFQTNILALNAAVEAARAGEAGMGFAVVADEVRNLAQRSAQAARDTAGLIEESIARSQEGAGKVQEMASAIGAITESVLKVKGIVEEVREASQQQTQGIDQVAQAIAQMEKVTQTTAATAEESAAASEELNAQAETAMDAIRRLEVLVGSTGSESVRDTIAPRREIRAAGSIVKFDARRAVPRVPVWTVEDEIPMDDTGTYGRF